MDAADRNEQRTTDSLRKRSRPRFAERHRHAAQAKRQPAWKALLSSAAAEITIALLIGIGLLFLVSRFVDIPTTIRVIQQSLSTPRGIILALLSGVAFLIAFSIRGIRWKLF